MAQKIEVTKVSDLSGAAANETVRFSLDGTEYEIDLSEAEAGRMREELGPFTARARRIRTARPRRTRAPSRDDLPDIREYARQRGHEIKDRGRIPGLIVAEYDWLKSYQASK